MDGPTFGAGVDFGGVGVGFTGGGVIGGVGWVAGFGGDGLSPEGVFGGAVSGRGESGGSELGLDGDLSEV